MVPTCWQLTQQSPRHPILRSRVLEERSNPLPLVLSVRMWPTRLGKGIWIQSCRRNRQIGGIVSGKDGLTVSFDYRWSANHKSLLCWKEASQICRLGFSTNSIWDLIWEELHHFSGYLISKLTSYFLPLNSKGNQPEIFTGRTDADAKSPVLWPPDVKSQLIGKDPDAGKDWR